MSLLEGVSPSEGLLRGGVTVQIMQAQEIQSPTGGTTFSWDDPELVATVQAEFQPAGAEALERAGLLGLVNAQSVFLEDTALIPETHRLHVGATVYRVRSVSRWVGSHVEAIVEVISG